MVYLYPLFLLTSFSVFATVCEQNNVVSSEALNLAQNTIAIVQSNYLQTDFGYAIDPVCVQRNASFEQTIRDTLTEGRACLRRLGDAGGRGAAQNLSALDTLLAGKVQVVCSEANFNWVGSEAHATLSDENNTTGLIHPSISISPRFSLDAKFKQVFFHEQLHNLGFRHGRDIEYSYACGFCCFPEENQTERTNLACKICSGNYQGSTDILYVADAIEYARKMYRPELGTDPAVEYVKQNPNDPMGFAFLADSLSGVLSPMGGELARITAERNELTGFALTSNTRTQANNRNNPLFVPYLPASRAVAEAYYQLYHEGNPTTALEAIRSHKNEIKAALGRAQSENGESYVRESLVNQLQDLERQLLSRRFRGRAAAIGPQDFDQISRDTYLLIQELELPAR